MKSNSNLKKLSKFLELGFTFFALYLNRETSYVISWILTYYTIGILIEFVLLLLLVLTNILNKGEAGRIIIAFILYLGSSVSLIMFITIFFND